MKAIAIAGTQSGVGKTTISVALMAALSSRGMKVQPFKAGPDYIDPSYHLLATGNPSRNLDTWLLPAPAVVEFFLRAMKGRDIGVIEGVMGLFDGRSASSDEGSTAELTKMLGIPVVLVVDAGGASRSLGAMVSGYDRFDPELGLSGVILNSIGSERHFKECCQAIEESTGVPVLGYMPRQKNLEIPGRHLGLVPAVEQSGTSDFLERLVGQCEDTIDIRRLVKLSTGAVPPAVESAGLFPEREFPSVTRIAVAQDKAFSFYYQDSLDLLAAWGAELVPFSPLSASALPPGTEGIYLGGGFPELHAETLEANRPMREAIKRASEQRMPVYAECGGLMYLGESIRDFQGFKRSMVGAIPVRSCIDQPRLSLGYRTLRAVVDSPLLPRGKEVRGHEFHWSVLEEGPEGNAYEVIGRAREGYLVLNTLASYVHLHMGSYPEMARRFIAACQGYGRGTGG